ncbi:PIG-L deacetylase family protein [Isoptericola halotolerans]|uniref:PIG-L deacetylase family protein n=1 Tax=Isoptericola halotolerans TaxID=300560 RepID=UPI00388E1399
MMYHLFLILLLVLASTVAVTRGDRLDRYLRRPSAVRWGVLGVTALLVPVNVLAATLPGGSDVALGIALASTTVVLLGGTGVLLLRRSAVRAARPRRVLAIGAHPDDLELACGGTLAKLVDTGHEVHAVVMSRGAVGGAEETRLREAQRGAAFLGARTVTVHDFPDTALAQAEQGLVMAIEAAIDHLDPDVILTHSGHDQHQDHAAVHAATLRAARQRTTILCFESPSVTRSFNPSVFIDIADHLDVKVQAVRLHRDQADKPYMSAQRLRGLATFRGAQAKREFAEGYEPVRVLGSALGEL